MKNPDSKDILVPPCKARKTGSKVLVDKTESERRTSARCFAETRALMPKPISAGKKCGHRSEMERFHCDTPNRDSRADLSSGHIISHYLIWLTIINGRVKIFRRARTVQLIIFIDDSEAEGQLLMRPFLLDLAAGFYPARR